MRKILIRSFMFVFVTLSLTACQQNGIQDKANLMKKTSSETNYKIAKLKSHLPSKSNINSKLDNAEEFIRTFNIIKNAAANGDKKTISEYINYPITVYINNNKTVIYNSQQFIKNYNNIFTNKVKAALKNQHLNTIQTDSNGIIIGKGEIYFNFINDGKHEYGIYSINNQ